MNLEFKQSFDHERRASPAKWSARASVAGFGFWGALTHFEGAVIGAMGRTHALMIPSLMTSLRSFGDQ
jgi:hypothetical protein